MTNVLGFHEPKTDFLETAADRTVFDMPNMWSETDPHPLDKAADHANQFVSSYSLNNSGTKRFFPDMTAPAGKVENGMNFTPLKTSANNQQSIPSYIPPSQAVNENGLLSNMPASNRNAKASNLLEQSINSVGVGDHADGALSTRQYEYVNSRDYIQPKPDESHLRARRQAQDEIRPEANMNNMQQTFSSIATRNLQRGVEMEEPMALALEHGKWDVYDNAHRAEATATSDLLGTVAKGYGQMAQENWPEATESAHGAETSYQKRFPEEMERYRTLLGRMLQGSMQATEEGRQIEGMNIQKNADDFQQGLNITIDDYSNRASKAMLMIGKGLEEATGKNIINEQAWSQHIEDMNQDVDGRLADQVQWNDIHVPGRPDLTLENLQSFTYQSVFGRYSFDLGVLYITRGWNFVANMANHVFGVASDVYIKTLAKHGDADFMGSLREGFVPGGKITLTEHVLTRLTDGLDPYSRMGLRFMISKMSEEHRRQLVGDILKRQDAAKSQGQQQP